MSSTPPSTNIDLYPEEAWFTLSVFLAVIGLSYWASVLHTKLVQQRRPQKTTDEESTHAPTSPAPGWSLARLPLAAVNVFRVVAFRWTLEFGTYELKVVDILLTLAYIAFLLVWTFVDSEYWFTPGFASYHYVVYLRYTQVATFR